MQVSLFSSKTGLLNPDLDLFLLSTLQNELVPPKVLFFMAGSKGLSQLLCRSLFPHSPGKPAVELPMGLTLSRMLLSTSSVLLVEAVGEWDYNSEFIGLALSNMVILGMEFEDLEDFEIEKLYDIVVRLEEPSEGKKPRDLVLYLVNVPENTPKELLVHSVTEKFRRKWEMFAKGEAWASRPLDFVFRIEIFGFQIIQNKADYIPIGFLTKTHPEDLMIPELNCLGGIVEELLRRLREGKEYVSLSAVKSDCYEITAKRAMNALSREFSEELLKFKKGFEGRVFDKIQSYSHELLSKYLSRYELRTHGIRGSLKGESSVMQVRQSFRENMTRDLLAFSKSQKTLILASCEELFSRELNKVLPKFKKTKSAKLLQDAKTSVLETIETGLQNAELSFLTAEGLFPSDLRSSENQTNGLFTLEDLMARFQARIQSFIEREHKTLYSEVSEAVLKEMTSILETALRGEDILLGREFWRRLKKKMQSLEEARFSVLRRNLMSLQIPESVILVDIEKLGLNLRTVFEFEMEKRKYRIEDYMMQCYLRLWKGKIKEIAEDSYIMGKKDPYQREIRVKGLKKYGEMMKEKMEGSVKEMRHIDVFEEKNWLSAEEINLIISVLDQNVERELADLEGNLRNAEKRVLYTRIGILIVSLIVVGLIFWRVRQTYLKIFLCILALGIGGFFSRLIPFRRKPKVLL